MTRFLVPAVIIIDGGDEMTAEVAEQRAALMQAAANKESRLAYLGGHLMLDEKRPTVAFTVRPDETEIPGTYLPNTA